MNDDNSYEMGPSLTCPSTFLTGDPTLPHDSIADGPAEITYHARVGLVAPVGKKAKAKSKSKAKKKGSTKGSGKGGKKRKASDDTNDDKDKDDKDSSTKKNDDDDGEKPSKAAKTDATTIEPAVTNPATITPSVTNDDEKKEVKSPGLNLRLEHTHFWNDDLV
jgi:hypothetical protein